MANSYKAHAFIFKKVLLVGLIQASFGAIAQSTPFVVDREYLNQPALTSINAAAAYNLGITGQGVKVGDMGTGVNWDHVEFSDGKVVAGINAATGVTGVGLNLRDSAPPFDHDTIVASIIAARRDGSTRPGNMQGVAYNANLVVASSFTTSVLAYPSPENDLKAANAINYVSSQGVKVINNSWGLYDSYATLQSTWPNMLNALKNASNSSLMVMAAGNNAKDNPATTTTLPSLDPSITGGWISVVATTNDGKSLARAMGVTDSTPATPTPTYTNYCGITARYCLSAPGGYPPGGPWGASNSNPNLGVLIPTNSPLADYGMTGAYGQTYDQYYSSLYFPGLYNGTGVAGTSFATAIVSGAGALVAERFPWMSSSQLATTLLTTASHAANPNEYDGRGLLNIEAAMKGPAIFETTFNANTQGYSSTFGNNISGDGGLIKSGEGVLTLSGYGTYRGDTQVTAGTLAFTGSGPTTGNVSVSGGTLQVGTSFENASASIGGNVSVGPTGRLFGYGTVGGASNTVTNAGRIGVSSDGGSIGTLKIGGNYVQTNSGQMISRIANGSNDVLQVAGKATLDGGLEVLAISPITRAMKYRLVATGGGVEGAFSSFTTNLSSYTSMSYYLSYDGLNSYLVLPPSASNTLASIQNNTNALASTLAGQASTQFAGLNYDCTLFGVNDVCISAGGRTTQVNSVTGVNSGGALIIAAHKIDAKFRYGGWLDQGFAPVGGNVQIQNSNPMAGLFGVYSHDGKKSGMQIAGSLSYATNTVSTTRQQLLNTEPGEGSSTLNSVAAKVELGYGLEHVSTGLISTPFVGYRYYNASINGYTENAQFPITYSTSTMGANTLFGGLKLEGKVSSLFSVMGSAGVESDLNNSKLTYAGSSQIAGLSTFSTQPTYSTKTTRPFASVGVYYEVHKNQQIGLTSYYRQNYYQSMNSYSSILTYTIGI
jgi:autotransporter-associated beta strand protein